jgi:hypothetical protein
MNVPRSISSFTGITLLFATASIAQQVKTDFDRHADFSQYKTYSWEKVHTQNPLWVDRIKDAVNSTLATKGWTQVESGGNVAIMAMEMIYAHTLRIISVKRDVTQTVLSRLKAREQLDILIVIHLYERATQGTVGIFQREGLAKAQEVFVKCARLVNVAYENRNMRNPQDGRSLRLRGKDRN